MKKIKISKIDIFLGIFLVLFFIQTVSIITISKKISEISSNTSDISNDFSSVIGGGRNNRNSYYINVD